MCLVVRDEDEVASAIWEAPIAAATGSVRWTASTLPLCVRTARS
jgi:hypothetical protein